jgi:hypothetical protein
VKSVTIVKAADRQPRGVPAHASGRFRIEFTELDFKDVVEQRPDLYLRIYDPAGRKELISTRRALRRNANAGEHYEIAIPPSFLVAIERPPSWRVRLAQGRGLRITSQA